MLTKPISAIAKRVSSGLTPLRSNAEFWQKGTIPWLKTEQLGEKFIYSTTEKISEAALRKTSIKVYQPNTLSIAMYGEGKTRGNVSIIKSEMATNQACCNIELEPDLADFEYVYYFLKTQYNELRNQSSGIRKNLNANDIKNFVVRLPKDLTEQKKIAAVLSALDAKIDCNNRINGELTAMAKTLYDYWFVQFDFPFDFASGKPDKNGKPYKSSGGKMVYNPTLKREIPAGWNSATASELLEFNPSLTLKAGNEASYIDMNSLPISGFMTSEPERKEFRGGAKFQNGDVVVARITPCLENGKTALITLLNNDEVGFGSTEFIVIRGRHQPLRGFAAQLSRSDSFRQFAISNMTGTSGRKRIDAKTLETYSLPVPPPEILLRFEKIVAPFYTRLTTNAKENKELTQLRDWLLPMLMNGQVTVVEP
jgi:type I restriction enzyme S subunit